LVAIQIGSSDTQDYKQIFPMPHLNGHGWKP
jgi:hypothetical protein